MSSVALIFPHQLFREHSHLKSCQSIYLIEEQLFFRQYAFHQRKIAFHRASMKAYATYLHEQGFSVQYIDSAEERSAVSALLQDLPGMGISEVVYIDPTDDWLDSRVTSACAKAGIKTKKLPSPLFLNQPAELQDYQAKKKKFFQTDFYIHQRLKRGILLDEEGKPVGGKWTFDTENRQKYPKNRQPPKVRFSEITSYHREAITYTRTHFGQNPGELDDNFLYPCTHAVSAQWLKDFLRERFYDFGTYEDSLVNDAHFLHHSVITPMLNVGLLTPQQVVEETLAFAAENEIPINSLEGFIRQIIGWREFMRMLYELKGRKVRTSNFWGFKRKIPAAFWQGTTGIPPVDQTIQKVLKTGYCHHIERLMVLGNFMLLCEFDPDEVYRWFMELFIDSYDWVMVPNVYSMSQFADGGLMATKPYISGSNYLMKMSDYPKGEWQATWDGLFWRFMHVHRSFFLQNPRLGMLIKTFDKMDTAKQKTHLENAEKFLGGLG